MATLFYWASRGGSLGHLSMKLDDGTYITHWPASRDKLGIKAKKGPTNLQLDDDLDVEQRKYDKNVKISKEKIDAGKVRAWWESMTNKNADLMFENSVQMVERALLAGGLILPGGNLTPDEILNCVEDGAGSSSVKTSEGKKGNKTKNVLPNKTTKNLSLPFNFNLK